MYNILDTAVLLVFSFQFCIIMENRFLFYPELAEDNQVFRQFFFSCSVSHILLNLHLDFTMRWSCCENNGWSIRSEIHWKARWTNQLYQMHDG